MLMGVFAVASVSVSATKSGDFQYTVLGDGTAEITDYAGSEADVVIPNMFGTYKVSTIGGSSISDNSSIKTITIPSTVTTIEENAFGNNKNLESVDIPKSVKTIEKYAFSDCPKLASVDIPDSVETIDDFAFVDCSALATITIGSGVTYIGEDVFRDTAYYKNESNWNNNVLYIDNCLIKANKDSFTGGYSVKGGTKLIAEDAFFECAGLTAVTIPISNVKSICDYAFYGCSNLETITFMTTYGKPDVLSKIGYSAFYNTKYYITTDNWEDDVLYIGKCLISAKDTVSSNYSVKSNTFLIADYAFFSCIDLESVTFPSSVKSIGANAFNTCDELSSVTLNDGLEFIGHQAFYDCPDLKEITVPDSVTTIETRALGFRTNEEGDDETDESFGHLLNNYYIKGINIKGSAGSEAERYAKDNGMSFNGVSYATVLSAKLEKTKIYVGDTTKVKTTIKYPKGDTIYRAGWTAYAKVNSKGVVTGLKAGEERILVKNNDKCMVLRITVVKKKNPMTVKPKTIKARAKKNTTYAKSKYLTIKKYQGKLSFAKKSGNKYIIVNKKTGKLTIKKGFRKGKTYKFKVKVTAKGNTKYKSLSKTVTVKFKVK